MMCNLTTPLADFINRWDIVPSDAYKKYITTDIAHEITDIEILIERLEMLEDLIEYYVEIDTVESYSRCFVIQGHRIAIKLAVESIQIDDPAPGMHRVWELVERIKERA